MFNRFAIYSPILVLTLLTFGRAQAADIEKPSEKKKNSDLLTHTVPTQSSSSSSSAALSYESAYSQTLEFFKEALQTSMQFTNAATTVFEQEKKARQANWAQEKLRLSEQGYSIEDIEQSEKHVADYISSVDSPQASMNIEPRILNLLKRTSAPSLFLKHELEYIKATRPTVSSDIPRWLKQVTVNLNEPYTSAYNTSDLLALREKAEQGRSNIEKRKEEFSKKTKEARTINWEREKTKLLALATPPATIQKQEEIVNQYLQGKDSITLSTLSQTLGENSLFLTYEKQFILAVAEETMKLGLTLCKKGFVPKTDVEPTLSALFPEKFPEALPFIEKIKNQLASIEAPKED